jgi:hypothetical protein
MRSEKAIAGRGVGKAYTLPEHREAYADDFGGESETLTPGNCVAWAKNSKSPHIDSGSDPCVQFHCALGATPEFRLRPGETPARLSLAGVSVRRVPDEIVATT